MHSVVMKQHPSQLIDQWLELVPRTPIPSLLTCLLVVWWVLRGIFWTVLQQRGEAKKTGTDKASGTESWCVGWGKAGARG